MFSTKFILLPYYERIDHTYVSIWHIPFKCVLDIFGEYERIGVTSLVGQEEDDHKKEEIHDHFFQYSFHLQLVHAQFAGLFK